MGDLSNIIAQGKKRDESCHEKENKKKRKKISTQSVNNQDETTIQKLPKKKKKSKSEKDDDEIGNIENLNVTGKKRLMSKLSSIKINVKKSPSEVKKKKKKVKPVGDNGDEFTSSQDEKSEVDDAEERLGNPDSFYHSDEDNDDDHSGDEFVDEKSLSHIFKLKSAEYQMEEPQQDSTQKEREKKKLLKLSKINERKAKTLPTQHPDGEKRTIFVGNVDCKLKRKEIASFFKKYGKIETVRIRGIAAEDLDISKKEAITTKKLHKKRDTIIAYVRFSKIEEAEEALKSNGNLLSQRHLRVDRAIKEVNNDNSVFVGNLPYDVENEKLHKHFSSCGKILDVRVVRSQETGAGKGFGFVTFDCKDAVELALLMDEKALGHRQLRIKTIVKKQKVKREEAIHQVSKVEKRKSLYFMKEDKPAQLKMKFKNRQKSKQTFCGYKIADKDKSKERKFSKDAKKRRFTAKLLGD